MASKASKDWRIYKGAKGSSCNYKDVDLFQCEWRDTGEKVQLKDVTDLKKDFPIYEIEVNGEIEKFAIKEVMKNFWMIFTYVGK